MLEKTFARDCGVPLFSCTLLNVCDPFLLFLSRIQKYSAAACYVTVTCFPESLLGSRTAMGRSNTCMMLKN